MRLYEVQYSREGDFKKAAKVMDLKKAHNSQAGIPDSVQPTALMHTLKLFPLMHMLKVEGPHFPT